MRYLLTIRFYGGAYHGWQVQENALAVQPVVQDALQRILGVRPDLSGCSRTDSGVHALAYCCHFDTDGHVSPERIVPALNFALPEDIAALSCRQVPDDFHARYSACGKEYLYRFINTPQRDPFYTGRALHISRPMNEQLLNTAAQGFLGTHDFSAFCSAGAKEGSKIRTVTAASVIRRDSEVLFTVAADGFLYNMVRIMAGTLLAVHNGRIHPEQIPLIIAGCERRRAGTTAPAYGLYLSRIYYESFGKAMNGNE